MTGWERILRCAQNDRKIILHSPFSILNYHGGVYGYISEIRYDKQDNSSAEAVVAGGLARVAALGVVRAMRGGGVFAGCGKM